MAVLGDMHHSVFYEAEIPLRHFDRASYSTCDIMTMNLASIIAQAHLLVIPTAKVSANAQTHCLKVMGMGRRDL